MRHITPRFLRPHAITIVNALSEVDNVMQYKETIISHTKVEMKKYSRIQKTDTENNDDILVVIDLNDCDNHRYVPGHLYEGEGFTARKGDEVIFNGEKLNVQSVLEVNPFGIDVQILELTCQRSA
ncbi:hypothetical protein EII25_03365 [Erysipelotrichaceae bacterium OH741_COT-311]|nr:hypothetical protein EII25_03365 [Erysipelotrichaceae bacterium OH741_COT-311]